MVIEKKIVRWIRSGQTPNKVVERLVKEYNYDLASARTLVSKVCDEMYSQVYPEVQVRTY